MVSGIPPRGSQRVSYTVLPQTRGRYRLGPLSVDITDPFALTRQRLEFDERDELLVTPEIEDLLAPPPTAPSGQSFGASRARQLFRTGEEYYTMRQYQEGDDLRRIHWPSVARTGELMIRQDESSRRANGLVFFDTRAAGLGRRTPRPSSGGLRGRLARGAAGSPRLLLRLGTAELPAAAVGGPVPGRAGGISHAEARSIGPALSHLRAAASAETSLVFVSLPRLPASSHR